MNERIRSFGQLAYEADVAARPLYHDGIPRPGWDQLSPLKQSTWEKNALNRCGCFNCLYDQIDEVTGLRLTLMRMVVCPTCGNKRCPHATDHRFTCTGSNDPAQPGSRYGGQPSQRPGDPHD